MSTATDPRPAGKVRDWADETIGFARAAGSPRSFARVMQVRLSQSSIGRWVCPEPIVPEVDLRELGPSVRIRSHTTDISVLGELTSGKSYAAAAACLPPTGDGVTIVDLGANTGLAARWLQQRCPGATLVCVEPEPGNVEVLRHNIATARPAGVVFPVCVGADERTVSLEDHGGEFAFAMADDPGGDIEVWTMEHVLKEAGVDKIDLLKCDIEGAERELFADCSEWIGLVRSAVVECHDDFGVDDLLRLLEKNGSDLRVVAHEEMEGFPCELVTLDRP
ncbi:MAG: FkbM family methyltransferase [Acidimicrobiales bacterium]|nr:FkbM family methyltransferase [Acidimicrobiales bacterium]